MGQGATSGDERRRAHRVMLRLPAVGRVGAGDYQEVEVVDIGVGGMQIRTTDFEMMEGEFDPIENRADFGLRIVARLAWAEPDADGAFLTGWEFEIEGEDEERVG